LRSLAVDIWHQSRCASAVWDIIGTAEIAALDLELALEPAALMVSFCQRVHDETSCRKPLWPQYHECLYYPLLLKTP